MARTYTYCVAVFVLPLLLFFWCLDYVGRTPLSHGNSFIDQTLDALRLLSAWFSLWSNAGRNSSFWSNWGSILGLLAFGLAFFGVADSWYERSARSLVASIAAMLDPAGPVSAPPSSRWKSSFVGVSTRGTLHGRAVTVALRASYAQRFNYNWLKLDLACRSPWPFEIKPRSAVERLLEKWEGSQTDTELDESLSVVSDAPLFYDWVRQQPVSQQILSLVTHHHLAGIGADPQGLPGVLRFSYTPVVFQSGRLLAGMPGALQEMEAFAVAVESSSMASAQPASGSPRQADSFVNAPPSSSAVAGGIRLKGLVLIMLGIALLSGVPASLVSAVVGQRGLLAASLITMLPWVGVGMIVAGVVLYRTPPHRV